MKSNIDKKAEYSSSRLETFRKKLASSSELQRQDNFCIYTTGSYGRLEASPHSDLDLFFLFDSEINNLSKISKTLIDADIINACRGMKLPEFSGDGEYLEVHNVKDIYSELGSRNDDYNNFFTARMLLLLESRAVYNQDFYDKAIESTVDRYYKDFHEHEKSFKPVFIVNDVIRFWRTMCLNYEHTRNRKAQKAKTKEENQLYRTDGHIKNLKLRFSRKLTCYSFLLSILWAEKSVLKQEDIVEIIKDTPLQRLEKLSINPKIKGKANDLISLYFWFLETTQIEKKDLQEWISNEQHRNQAFEKSRDFAKNIFDLMIANDNKDALMYFLV